MPAMPFRSRPRIALLGCGRIAGRVHLPVLARLDGIELAAIAETDPELRDSCRDAAPRLAVFSDYRELLDGSAVDAAVICLPNDLHAAAAVACFERGLHVYVEKPLASTVEEGESVLAAWRRAGTVGAIGYNLRFHPLAVRLRDAMRERLLGEPVAAHTVFCAARRELPSWKRRRSTGGGAMLDLASHHLDLMRFMFDSEIVDVHASVRSVETEDDTAVVTLRLANGSLTTTLASLAAADEDRIAVYGTRGGLVFDRYRSSRLAFVPPLRPATTGERLRAGCEALAAAAGRVRDAVRAYREPSFEIALAAFADAARGGTWPGADLDDGLRSLAVVVEAERAAATSHPVAMRAAR